MPALVIRLAGTVTVQEVARGAVHAAQLSGVGTPQNFQLTEAVFVSAVPAMVSTTGLVLPAVAFPVMPLMAGTGLIVNTDGAELTPSALSTVTLAVPAEARSEVPTVTEQVVEAHEVAVRPVTLPFHFTR